MKTFKNMAAQGDFLIRRISALPKDVVPVKPRNDGFVVAHSETGHDHVMTMDGVRGYQPAAVTRDADLYQLFFEVDRSAEINHLRSFDTHETLQVDKGIYEVRRQREHTPEGFRRAAD